MRCAAAIGQSWRKKWRRAAGAASTMILLLAVVAGGISLLGSEGLAAWKAAGNAEQSLGTGGFFAGLLNFEAPAQTVAQVKIQMEESEQNIRRAGNAAVLVKNWRYTQNSIADLLQLSLQALNQDLLFLQAAINNYMMLVQQIEANAFSAVAAYINALLTAYANLVNSFTISFAPIINTNTSTSTSSSHSASPYR